jgi:NADPH:quinone reductase-like Zn-dependent oxidoreductase
MRAVVHDRCRPPEVVRLEEVDRPVPKAVGVAVTRFRVGDEVFGIRAGANAEYVCVREHRVLDH